jgi:hypothetical protein
MARHGECRDAFSAQDADTFGACIAENGTHEAMDSGMPPAEGREAGIEGVQQFWAAFPDLKGYELFAFASGTTIASVTLYTGGLSLRTCGGRKSALLVVESGDRPLWDAEPPPAQPGTPEPRPDP